MTDKNDTEDECNEIVDELSSKIQKAKLCYTLHERLFAIFLYTHGHDDAMLPHITTCVLHQRVLIEYIHGK